MLVKLIPNVTKFLYKERIIQIDNIDIITIGNFDLCPSLERYKAYIKRIVGSIKDVVFNPITPNSIRFIPIKL